MFGGFSHVGFKFAYVRIEFSPRGEVQGLVVAFLR